MKIYQVDAFTDTPFRGNPAGVCLLETDKDDGWLHGVAAEMNLSETAFLRPTAEGRYGLRWLTPTTEVSLCGHATLASAHVLRETGHLAAGGCVSFDTRSGVLTAGERDGWIEMDFPIRRVVAAALPADVAQALGARPIETHCRAAEGGGMTYLFLLETETEVRGLAPDYRALRAAAARAVIVTAPSADGRYDFVSRFFAPAIGIEEDPVTGSAHCYLAPYWAQKLGKKDLVGHQVSARGGVVGCSPRGERVLLRGQAVTTMGGEILV